VFLTPHFLMIISGKLNNKKWSWSMNINCIVTCSESVRIKMLIILVLYWVGISCTTQNEIEIPEHLSRIQNLVIIQPNSESAPTIELIRDVVINDENVSGSWYHDNSSTGLAFLEVFWFAGLEIDDSGRIFVGNSLEKKIQIFDKDGKHLINIGREGNGPGEFNGITEIKIQSNQLIAFDFLQFRVTFFSLDSLNVDKVNNAYLSRTPDIEELNGWFSNGYHLIDDERFLVKYVKELVNANVGTPTYNLDKPRHGNYYIVNSEGEVVSDMLFSLRGEKIITANVEARHLFNFHSVPFLNQPLITISDDGHIASANSEEPLIKMYAPNGDYLRAFYLPMQKKALLRDELLLIYGEVDEENENLLKHAELPETWPALEDIIMDDKNRVWISTITVSDKRTYTWWVLQDTGELLTTFSWPGNRSIEKIKDGYVYVRETEESTGQQTVVKYRVEMD